MAKQTGKDKSQTPPKDDKVEAIRKKNLEESNRLLAEQLNLVGQIKDKITFLNKANKENYTQNNLAVESVKKATKLTQSLASQYNSINDIQKDLAKNDKLINEIARQKITLEKEIGKEGTERLKNIKEQEKGLDKSKELLSKLREQETLGVKGAKEKADELARQYFEQSNALIAEKESLSIEEQNYSLLQQTSKTLEANNEYLNESLETQKALTSTTAETFDKIDSALNKIGAGGISKYLKLKDLSTEMKRFRYEMTEGGTKPLKGFPGLLKRAAIGFKSLGSVISTVFSPLAMIGFFISGVQKLFGHLKKGYQEGLEAAKKISGENVSLARSLGLAQGAASKLAGAVRGMGPTQAASVQSAEALYGAMGGTEKLSQKTLKTFIGLNTFAGMSAENLADIHKFAKLSGDDSGVVAEHMADAALSAIKNNKLAVSQKVLLGDVAKTSDVIKLRFKGQEGELVKIVADAKKYGLELAKAEDIANSLLNIEDSLAAEMEAELLTGKELNLEKAREAALNGDVATLQEEIAKNAGSIEEFNKMNVVQQEAYAKAVGLSRQDLAKMLSDQKSNLALNGNLVDEQEDGLAAMQSGVSLAEREEEIERAKQAASLGYFKALDPLVQKIREAAIRVKKVFADWFGEKLQKLLTDPEVKKFINDMPDNAEKLAKRVTGMLDKIGEFVKNNPIISTLGYLFGGKVAGGAIRAAGTILGNVGTFLGRKMFEGLGWKKKQIGDKSNPSYTIVENLPESLSKNIPDSLKGPQQDKNGQFRDEKGRFAKDPSKEAVDAVKEASEAQKEESKEQTNSLKKQANKNSKEQSNLTKKASRDIKRQTDKNARDTKRTMQKASRDISRSNRQQSSRLRRITSGLSRNVKKLGRDSKKMFRDLNRSMKGMFRSLKTKMSGLFRNLNNAVRRIGKGGGGMGGMLGMLGPIGMVAGLALSAGTALASGEGLGGALEAIDPTGLVGAVRDRNDNDMGGDMGGGYDMEMAAGGIVNKPTKALVGEAGPEAVIPLREFYAKMDELIAAVKQGGNVYMDSRKVGESLVIGGYKMG